MIRPVGIPGIFDGRYRFEIKAIKPNVISIAQTEEFLRIAMSTIPNLVSSTLEAFVTVNKALAGEVKRRRIEKESR